MKACWYPFWNIHVITWESCHGITVSWPTPKKCTLPEHRIRVVILWAMASKFTHVHHIGTAGMRNRQLMDSKSDWIKPDLPGNPGRSDPFMQTPTARWCTRVTLHRKQTEVQESPKSCSDIKWTCRLFIRPELCNRTIFAPRRSVHTLTPQPLPTALFHVGTVPIPPPCPLGHFRVSLTIRQAAFYLASSAWLRF